MSPGCLATLDCNGPPPAACKAARWCGASRPDLHARSRPCPCPPAGPGSGRTHARLWVFPAELSLINTDLLTPPVRGYSAPVIFACNSRVHSPILPVEAVEVKGCANGKTAGKRAGVKRIIIYFLPAPEKLRYLSAKQLLYQHQIAAGDFMLRKKAHCALTSLAFDDDFFSFNKIFNPKCLFDYF